MVVKSSRKRLAGAVGTATVTVWLGVTPAVAAVSSFTLFGDVINTVREVDGASGDGTFVVGQMSINGIIGLPAFRWSQATGLTSLGNLPGGVDQSIAMDSSLDGSVVVGLSNGALGQEAFMWTPGGGMVGIGDFPGNGFLSNANAVSDDGAVIVGWGVSASGQEAFRWTQATGMVGLGDLTGGEFKSVGMASSSDGSTITGFSVSASGQEAFRWTQATGMVGLGNLPGGPFFGAGEAVSDDGSVIVGSSISALSNPFLFGEAFRWTQATGMVGLGFLPGSNFSRPTAVSGDGSVIVGQSGTSNSSALFIWTQADGMRFLETVLVNDFGLDLQGFSLANVQTMSADGITISGLAANPLETFFRGYVAVLGTPPPPPPPACPGDANGDKVVNFADITETLANWLNDCR